MAIVKNDYLPPCAHCGETAEHTCDDCGLPACLACMALASSDCHEELCIDCAVPDEATES